MTNTRAILMNENEVVMEFLLTVFPYGLYAHSLQGEYLPELERQLLLRSQQCLAQGLISREALSKLGRERPEGYVYIHAAVRQFQLPEDDIWVRYPNEDMVSLYPADFTYRQIHLLQSQRMNLQFEVRSSQCAIY